MNLEPRPLAVERTADDEVIVHLAVPAQLPCFADHFRDAPMLPGVLQLGWAVRLAQQQFGIDVPLRQVVHLKFQSPIRPEQTLSLRLVRNAPSQVQFTYATPSQACSSGRLHFAGDA